MTNERKIIETTLEEYLAGLEKNRFNEEWIRRNISCRNLRYLLKGDLIRISKQFEESGRFRIEEIGKETIYLEHVKRTIRGHITLPSSYEFERCIVNRYGFDILGAFPGEWKSSLEDFRLKADSEFGKGKGEDDKLVCSLMYLDGIEDLGKCLIEYSIPALVFANSHNGYADFDLHVYNLKEGKE